MNAHQILSANILDIIFEGRNKAYGAYQLRKNHNRTVLISLFISSSLATLIFIALSGANHKHAINPPVLMDVDLRYLSSVEEIKAQAPSTLQSRRNVIRAMGSPIVVDNNIDLTEPNVIINDPGNGTGNESASNNFTAGAGTGNEPATANVPETGTLRPDSNQNTVLTHVQIDASFPGGESAWTRYIRNKLDPNTPVTNGAPVGTYRIVVRFIVSKTGDISDVAAETNYGYGMEEEAIRIIKKGPDWVPAMQNGHQVNAYRWQPIIFVVSED